VISAAFHVAGAVQPSYPLYAELQLAMQSFVEYLIPHSDPPCFKIPQGDGQPAVLVTTDPRAFKLFDGHGFLDTACRFHCTYAALPAAASVLDVFAAFGSRLRVARAALGIEPSLLLAELDTIARAATDAARAAAVPSGAPSAAAPTSVLESSISGSISGSISVAQLECLERGAVLSEPLLGLDLGLVFHRLQKALHRLLRSERRADDGTAQYLLGVSSAVASGEAEAWRAAAGRDLLAEVWEELDVDALLEAIDAAATNELPEEEVEEALYDVDEVIAAAVWAGRPAAVRRLAAETAKTLRDVPERFAPLADVGIAMARLPAVGRDADVYDYWFALADAGKWA
jgi:hypothetical protein